MSVKNSIDTIGNRTRDLPTCSALRYRVPPYKHIQKLKTVGETTNYKLEVPYYDKFYVKMK
jgi:hypothetical protein